MKTQTLKFDLFPEFQNIISDSPIPPNPTPVHPHPTMEPLSITVFNPLRPGCNKMVTHA